MSDKCEPLTFVDLATVERFWSFVDKSGECWRWTQALSGGYGRFRAAGRRWWVHRFAHELLIGAIPAGFQVDHLCNNTACVRPDHLEAVSQQENLRRQGVRQTECKRGHDYTLANTVWHEGNRKCRTCANARQRARRAARREGGRAA